MFDFIAQQTTNRDYLELVYKFIEKGISDEKLCNTETSKEIEMSEKNNIDFITKANYVAKWVTKFSEAETKDDDFTIESGEKIKIPMMHHSFTNDMNTVVKCEVTSEYEIICLPCEKGTLIYFIKPKVDQPVRCVLNLRNILHKFTLEPLPNNVELQISIPKINDIKDEFNLKEILRNMGFSMFLIKHWSLIIRQVLNQL